MKTICIIGAGPSGLFCAYTLIEEYRKINIKDKIKIIVIEKGNPPSNRSCPGQTDGICRNCKCCSILSGGSGAGLFSDGKLIQDLNVGGHNSSISSLTAEEKSEYINWITKTLLDHDGKSVLKDKPEINIQKEYSEKFAGLNLKAKYYGVCHMGTGNLPHILNGFIQDLLNNTEITIEYNTNITQITSAQNGYNLYSEENLICSCNYLVIAAGKSGASWMKDVLSPLGVQFIETGFYFGLRLQVPRKYLIPLSKLSFDPKIYRILDNDRKIKMHCFCRRGDVIITNYNNYVVAGGHSPYTEHNTDQYNRELYGNFNVLMSYPKTEDCKILLDRFKAVSSRTLLVQSLGDFRKNSITKKKYSADKKGMYANIRSTIQDDFFSKEFINFIDSLDQVFHGIGNNNNLIYGPAFEWCMDTVKVSTQMETNLKNLFTVGDGAGLSQGIIYSAMTGILAANGIITKIRESFN